LQIGGTSTETGLGKALRGKVEKKLGRPIRESEPRTDWGGNNPKTSPRGKKRKNGGKQKGNEIVPKEQGGKILQLGVGKKKGAVKSCRPKTGGGRNGEGNCGWEKAWLSTHPVGGTEETRGHKNPQTQSSSKKNWVGWGCWSRARRNRKQRRRHCGKARRTSIRKPIEKEGQKV